MNPFIQSVVAEAIRDQPWFKKNANTIVAGITALAAVLSFVATLGLDLPSWAAASIPVITGALGTLATKLTPNGVQPSTAKKLEDTPLAKSTLPVDAFVDEVRRIAPAPGDVQAAISAEVQRWQSQAQNVMDDYTGRHRGE